ncbi:AAA family ATPase [Thiotrichales bacterium HSG1]|nr:AAA family ATPase [Thiotrichales bacterium HSG1]
MIKKIHIENYKSIFNLDIEIGRVNIFIGENGSGKTNILEALAFVAAAQTDKLDNEFLANRGIRITSPELTRSRFDDESIEKPIKINLFSDNNNRWLNFIIHNNNKPYSKWKLRDLECIANNEVKPCLNFKTKIKYDKDISLNRMVNNTYEVITTREIIDNIDIPFLERLKTSLQYKKLNDFIIYSPENTSLRNFYKEGQIEPLGVNGEGLLKLLQVIAQDEEKINLIIETLELFNWFDSLEIPKQSLEEKVIIQDRFLKTVFDQRSTNEGFLFILFYAALMVSDDTPAIFAVDNIDASLNPKLCTELIENIADLAKQFDKQVFLTSHNPAILDGIDLNDDEQRLFVVSRNKQGHTRVKRITADSEPKYYENESTKLSEAMLRGYLGGLPKNF